jgi:hypothetical protein
VRLFGADFRFEFHRHNPGLGVVVAFPWRVDVGGGEQVHDDGGGDPRRHDQGRLDSIGIMARQHP